MKAKRIITVLMFMTAFVITGCGRRSDAWPTATATPHPTATPVPTSEARTVDVDELLANMTLEEKVGQLFFVRPDALDPAQSAARAADASAPGVREMTEALGNMLVRCPVGGVVIFSKNIASPAQLREFLSALQSASKTPLFIAVDEEGGAVSRLAGAPGFGLPRHESAAVIGAGGDPEAGLDMGRRIGAYLREYGFSMDFAPVADVRPQGAVGVIGDRAFSDDPAVVSDMAAAMAAGLLEHGIIPVYKHFPGHGGTEEDSHLAVAVTRKSTEELRSCDWLPYLRGDLSRCAVMAGHIAVPALTGDMTPASLSEILVNGTLRSELGFEGLVITDSLAMQAVTGSYTSGEAAVQALLAGCDVLLMPQDLLSAYAAVLSAVRNGEVSEARIDESVKRILSCKALAGLL